MACTRLFPLLTMRRGQNSSEELSSTPVEPTNPSQATTTSSLILRLLLVLHLHRASRIRPLLLVLMMLFPLPSSSKL
jgi:hypothetical protein